jgi:hypothetical protein
MAAKYKQQISAYCQKHHVEIPPGFGRNTPSRYAIIRCDKQPPKLIAMTWNKTSDVIYYIDNFLIPELGESADGKFLVLDFRDAKRLSRKDSRSLDEVGDFELV